MRRSFSLIEVIVASSILALVSVVSFSLLTVLQRANATVANNVDIASDARRLVGDIARDIRQTGWTYDEATKTNFERGPATTNALPGFGPSVFGDTSLGALPVLSFRKRTGFADDLEADWNEWVQYQVVVDGVFSNVAGTPVRYALQRRVATDTDANGAIGGEPATTVEIANNLSRVVFLRPDGGNAGSTLDDRNIDIRIAFTRVNPDGRLGAPPPGITVEYRERVRMANLPESRD